MKELMDIKRWGQSKWRMPLIVAVLAVVIIGSIWLNVAPFRSGFEITDELGGNIFPSSKALPGRQQLQVQTAFSEGQCRYPSR